MQINKEVNQRDKPKVFKVDKPEMFKLDEPKRVMFKTETCKFEPQTRTWTSVYWCHTRPWHKIGSLRSSPAPNTPDHPHILNQDGRRANHRGGRL